MRQEQDPFLPLRASLCEAGPHSPRLPRPQLESCGWPTPPGSSPIRPSSDFSCACVAVPTWAAVPRALGQPDISFLGRLRRRSWALHAKGGAGRSPSLFPSKCHFTGGNATAPPPPRRAVDGLVAAVSLTRASLCLRRVHNPGGQ